MLSPALATMREQLDTTDAQIGVTQTAFFASAALFSLFLPRWGDLVGRKKILLLALGGTTIGCVVAALAPNVAILGVGRVIQGIAGPIVPMALIMLHVQVPDPKRYAKLMAVLTAVNGGIAGVDALAGGWLAGNWGFRSVFWAMAIVCVIAILAVLAVPSNHARRSACPWTGWACSSWCWCWPGSTSRSRGGQAGRCQLAVGGGSHPGRHRRLRGVLEGRGAC